METRTTISTLRHAHTQYNAERRYAGTIDVPLSESGVADARRAAAELAQFRFDVVVTSTLRRSYETARILVGEKVPVVRCRLCDERKFGIMEGLTWDEVQSLEPPILMIRVGNDLHTVNPSGGEPFEDVWERAKAFRRYLLESYGGSNILVISHAVFLQFFHGLLRGLSCIESLAAYPSNLELARFCIADGSLAEERVLKLGNATTQHW